ncbi:MAG: Gfo/Idh/MocA family oxidoreductase [Cyanobacteriota bacterium]|nr:Gfo/Idh/MocA family oxidoreductase [Cyanobacteriota bacterium]
MTSNNSPSKPIGIAVIGVGRWGTHLTRNFANHPQANLVAVIDRHPERLAACRERLQLGDRAVFATQWDEVRQLETIDALVIATPATTHYDLIRDALETGYHVFAEKPLTLNPNECLELTRLAEQKQLQLLVDHTYLFNPIVEKGQQIVTSGQLGELRYGYATRTNLGPVRYDVDALWDLAIHDICIFNHWLGEKPTQVQATGRVWLQPQVSPSTLTPSGLSDLVWMTLTYPSGFQADIHVCWLNADKQRRLGVAGSEGTLVFDELNQNSPLSVQRGSFEVEEGHFVPAGLGLEEVEVEAAEPLRRACDRFLGNIQSSTPASLSSGWVAAELVQILTGLSQSLALGGQVVAVPDLEK